MSLDATRWAWQQSDIRATEKLVLLSLADRADEFHVCYPSIARLEKDTLLDRKTVMSAIASLELSGLISVVRGVGSANKYLLIGVDDRHATSTKNGTTQTHKTSTKNGTSTIFGTSTKNGTTPVPKTVLQPVPKTGHKSTNESTNESTKGLIGQFDVFWSAWPKHVAKAEAIKAFSSLKPSTELLEKIIADVRARLSSGEWEDRKFIPHPATYIRGKRWEDDLKNKPTDSKPDYMRGVR